MYHAGRLFFLILLLLWSWSTTAGWAAPLYTKSDAGCQDARTTKPTPIISGPPTLPSFETLIDGKRHRIFITIDDHPGRRTEQYLDLLKSYGLKATFFIVAYPLYYYIKGPTYKPVARMIDSVRRIVREGHLLGNHSVSHQFLCQMTERQVKWEIGKSQLWVKQILGVDLKLWRPPHGHLCPLVQKVVASWKLTTIMWDVDDYRSTPESMVRIIKIRIRQGATSTTTLFHNDIKKITKFLLLLPPVRATTP